MTDAVGLSVGATNLTAVAVGRAAVTRSAVLTRYAHRPAEVGVPGENPNLTEPGLVLTDFVDRVGDPVAMLAVDGSTHRAEVVLAEALRALLYTVPHGQQVAVTYPAHWRPAAVEALRVALAAIPEFGAPQLVSDATAAVTALADNPGVPARGIIALCDFGGSGTSITLVDAANGYQPIAAAVRHTDLSGSLIDQALLTNVIGNLSAAGAVDLSSTLAIGSLIRLRALCRAAKERLSAAAAAAVAVDLPGHSTEVRLTRDELDAVLRGPLADFTAVLQDTMQRSGIQSGDLVAVASAGGGARIPIVTTTLSEHFRVPVVTTPQPALTAAIGGGLRAARGPADEGATSMAALAAVAPVGDAAMSSTFRALAWSEDTDVDLTPEPQPFLEPAAEPGGPRPELHFGGADLADSDVAAPLPWFRRPAIILALGAVVVLAVLAVAVMLVMRTDETPAPASTTTTTTTVTTTATPPPTSAAPPPPETPAPQTQAPPQTRTVTRQAPPPPITHTPSATEAPHTTEAPPPTTHEPSPTEEPPPTTTRPPFIPTIPPIPTIPGLPPFIPQPGQQVSP